MPRSASQVSARWFAAAFAACIIAAPSLSAHAQSSDAPKGQWRPLFDGKTLDGWHHFGEGKWVVEDGAIFGRTQKAAKLYSLLVSDAVYHDFTVRLKFKSIKGNSGFYVRTVLQSPDQAHGLQIEVDPRNNSGGIYESYGRAWIARPDPQVYARAFKPDDWNELVVAAYGGDVKVTLNGQTTAEIKDDPSRPAGQLAMQMHAGNEMLVMFKDIEINPVARATEDIKGPTAPQTAQPAKDGSLVLRARHARLTGKDLAYMPEWDALGFWQDQDHARWAAQVARAGDYDVVMEWSVADDHAGNPFALVAGSQRLEGKVASTGRWDVYRRERVGTIRLEAGEQTITLRPDGRFTTALMDLRELRLAPRNEKSRR